MQALLEQFQVRIYLITLSIAVVVGLSMPVNLMEALPIALGILMYGMFVQIPFLKFLDILKAPRFLCAILLSNFVIIPLLLSMIFSYFPDHPALQFGILLVLLTPCIDYVVVFTALGKGDGKLMLAATPMLLILQILLLPIYIYLFLGQSFVAALSIQPFVESFFVLMLLPCVAAVLVQSIQKHRWSQITQSISNALPVPLMALVLFIIVSSNIAVVVADLTLLQQLIPIYIGFMVIMFLINLMLGRSFKLPSNQLRTVIYSAGTRNSLAVLPFALALPSEWVLIAITAIVTQTLVELVGELIYVRITPKIHG